MKINKLAIDRFMIGVIGGLFWRLGTILKEKLRVEQLSGLSWKGIHKVQSLRKKNIVINHEQNRLDFTLSAQ